MQLSIPSSIRPLRPSEHLILLEQLEEPEFPEGPLDDAELAMATLYWRLFAGNIIGDNHCEGGCIEEMPNSGLLTNNAEQVHKAVLAHVKIGLELTCDLCARRHFTISEALSYHSELLRCAAVKDSRGALKASRRRDALLKSLREG